MDWSTVREADQSAVAPDSLTTLAHFTATRTELLARSGAVFGMIAAGKLKLRIAHTYPLAEAQQAHRDLEGRKTTGKLLLIP